MGQNLDYWRGLVADDASAETTAAGVPQIQCKTDASTFPGMK